MGIPELGNGWLIPPPNPPLPLADYLILGCCGAGPDDRTQLWGEHQKGSVISELLTSQTWFHCYCLKVIYCFWKKGKSRGHIFRGIKQQFFVRWFDLISFFLVFLTQSNFKSFEDLAWMWIQNSFFFAELTVSSSPWTVGYVCTSFFLGVVARLSLSHLVGPHTFTAALSLWA